MIPELFQVTVPKIQRNHWENLYGGICLYKKEQFIESVPGLSLGTASECCFC